MNEITMRATTSEELSNSALNTAMKLRSGRAMERGPWCLPRANARFHSFISPKGPEMFCHP